MELRRQYFELADSGGSQIEGEYRETPLNAFELDVIYKLQERGEERRLRRLLGQR